MNMTSHFLQIVALCVWSISGGALASKVWPCHDKSNACVGDYLAKHSDCSLNVPGSSLDHYREAGPVFYYATPYYNTSQIWSNIAIEGLDQTYVQDFFTNTASGKAVLTLFFPTIKYEGDSLVHIQVPGDEGYDVATHYVVDFNDVTLTTIFDDYKNPTLEKSQTFSYIPKPPTYSSGKGLQEAAKTDPRVAKLLETSAKNSNVATLEAFQYRGPALAQQFINNKLCKYN